MLSTPLSWIKKTLVILKSNFSANQIAFAFALGIFAGLPPIGLHILIPSTLALVFRCSFRAFLISTGIFKLISIPMAPVSHTLGQWLLDTQRGLDRFWRWLFHLPVVAPMEYSRYVLMGSLALALILAIPVFLLMRLLVKRYRESFSTWVSGWTFSRWLRGKRGVGLARKFLAGGEAKYMTTSAPRGLFRLIRREMLIGLPVLYAASYLIAAAVVPFFAGTVATSTTSLVVGSDVTVSDASFSLFTGGLVLTDFTIQDPKVPEENLVSIPELVVDTGMLPLLSKRVVLNSVVIADAALHVKREPDGTLNIDNATSGWDASGYLEWAAQHADQVDWLGLLRRLFDYLSQWNPLAVRDDAYADYGGGRVFPDYEPPFAIQRLEIGRILISMEDETASASEGPLPPITLFEVEVSNLAFPSSLRTEPIRLSLRGQWGDDPDAGFELSATFVGTENDVIISYDFAMKRIDLPRLASFYATTLPVRISSGLASISGSLRLEGESARGAASFLLEDFEIDPISDQSLFGLPVGTSLHIIQGINHYASEIPIVFGAAIEGSSDAPQPKWEAALLEIAREGLMMAGRRELDRTIEELGVRIDGLGGIEDVILDPSFEAAQRQTEAAARTLIENAATGLIQGLPSRGDLTGDTTAPSSDDDGEPAMLDLLPRLLDSLLDSSAATDETDEDVSSSE